MYDRQMSTKLKSKRLLKVIVSCNSCNSELTISSNEYHSNHCKCQKIQLWGNLSNYTVVGSNKTVKTISDTDDFSIVRKHATRGTRGKHGKQKVVYKPLCELSNAHLERIIHLKSPAWHLNLILKEINYREQNKIFIEDGTSD